MKQSEIQVGKVYRNAGKGKTTRKVIGIDIVNRCVNFEQTITFLGERDYILGLAQFARWAGSEVVEKPIEKEKA